MPVVKINSVAVADIVKCNGIAAADIAKLSGVEYSTSATRWVVGAEDGFIAHAANSDRTSWSVYDSIATNDTNNNKFSIAFGKNSSGAGVYICTRDGGARELQISGDDVTTSAAWTDISIDGTSSKVNIMQVLWGVKADGATAGIWMAVGNQTGEEIFRSTDGGANWSAIDLSGLTNHASNTFVNGIATDGLGNWMFGQGDRIYYSTNDGASFNVSVPSWSNNEVPGRMHGITFTNNSWVISYSRSSSIKFRSCAASDVTDWGDEVDGVNLLHMSSNGDRMRFAASAGRVVAVTSKLENNLNYFDVDGKVISDLTNVVLTMNGDNLMDVATDGTTWLAACLDGDIWESTNAGAAWSQVADAQSSDDFESITCDVVLPL